MAFALRMRHLNRRIFTQLSLRPCSWACSHFTVLYKSPKHVELQFNSAIPRAFFSQILNTDDAEGPSAVDYSSHMREEEFHHLADEMLNHLQETFEEYGDSVQIDGFDVDYGNQVLTLKLGHLGTYVLNKQTPNRQIWLSSPLSGPSRFDWDRSNQSWVYRRTQANLLHLLKTELERLCGGHLNL